jgi:three-Cys-motif partner protein
MAVYPEFYAGREQSYAKHLTLRNYLAAFVPIIGSRWDCITYVDCFSGPWRSASEEYKDTSFSIAIDQLRSAREILKQRNRAPQLRCLFIEKNAEAYSALADFAAEERDIEICTLQADFVQSIPAIRRFVQEVPRSFPFFFVDPTGWKDIDVETLHPLLEMQPSEFLINLMTSHIHHWFGDETKPFEKICGTENLGKLQNLRGRELDDAFIGCYASRLRGAGRFNYSCSTLIPNPQRDAIHFALIYLTRSLKGVEEFKRSEKRSMEMAHVVRATAQQRRRILNSGQGEMFGADEVDPARFFRQSREHYSAKARRVLQLEYAKRGQLDFDTAWPIAARLPFVWENDVKEWLRRPHLYLRAEAQGFAARS